MLVQSLTSFKYNSTVRVAVVNRHIGEHITKHPHSLFLNMSSFNSLFTPNSVKAQN